MAITDYVAELDIPSALYTSPSERGVLPNPVAFGLVKGYWKARIKPDHLGTSRSIGLSLIVQLTADDQPSAEDDALAAGLKLSQLVSLHAGSPLMMPVLRRLARIGPRDGVLEQHEYFYEIDQFERLPRVKLRKDELDKLLRCFSELNPQQAWSCELAARWYGIAVGATDPVDAYLAIWIGLESIGALADRRFHKSGPKAKCLVCGNIPGQKRDRRFSGIEHTIRRVAPELLESHTVESLAQVRHDIAHGLRSAEDIRRDASAIGPDLLPCFAATLLAVIRPEDMKHGAGKGALPREFEFRPNARATIQSTIELVHHRPYFGEWVQIEVTLADERSRVGADGSYAYGAAPKVNYRLTVPTPALKISQEYVRFERMGHIWSFPEREDGQGAKPPRVVPWRDRPVSPAWKRLMTERA